MAMLPDQPETAMMKDEVRAEEMARLQADLEARAADASKGAALRQLRAIMVRIMKGGQLNWRNRLPETVWQYIL